MSLPWYCEVDVGFLLLCSVPFLNGESSRSQPLEWLGLLLKRMTPEENCHLTVKMHVCAVCSLEKTGYLTPSDSVKSLESAV